MPSVKRERSRSHDIDLSNVNNVNSVNNVNGNVAAVVVKRERSDSLGNSRSTAIAVDGDSERETSNQASKTQLIATKTHFRSPLSSCFHDESLTLASGVVLDRFGPTVQTVFDCLASKGPLTLFELRKLLKQTCSKVENSDRKDVMSRLLETHHLQSQAAQDTESAGYVVDDDSISQALAALINQNIVSCQEQDKIKITQNKQQDKQQDKQQKISAAYRYQADVGKVLQIIHYTKYCDHVRSHFESPRETNQIVQSIPSRIVKHVLCEGMVRTKDLLYDVAEGCVIALENEMDECDAFTPQKRSKVARNYQDRCCEILRLLEEHFILVPSTDIIDPCDESSASNDDDATSADEDVPVAHLGSYSKWYDGTDVWEVNTCHVERRMRAEKVGEFVHDRTEVVNSRDVSIAALFACAKVSFYFYFILFIFFRYCRPV